MKSLPQNPLFYFVEDSSVVEIHNYGELLDISIESFVIEGSKFYRSEKADLNAYKNPKFSKNINLD